MLNLQKMHAFRRLTIIASNVWRLSLTNSVDLLRFIFCGLGSAAGFWWAIYLFSLPGCDFYG
jgi:hypothetical protein